MKIPTFDQHSGAQHVVYINDENIFQVDGTESDEGDSIRDIEAINEETRGMLGGEESIEYLPGGEASDPVFEGFLREKT